VEFFPISTLFFSPRSLLLPNKLCSWWAISYQTLCHAHQTGFSKIRPSFKEQPFITFTNEQSIYVKEYRSIYCHARDDPSHNRPSILPYHTCMLLIFCIAPLLLKKYGLYLYPVPVPRSNQCDQIKALHNKQTSKII
jgi:hypothetical protein